MRFSFEKKNYRKILYLSVVDIGNPNKREGREHGGGCGDHDGYLPRQPSCMRACTIANSEFAV